LVQLGFDGLQDVIQFILQAPGLSAKIIIQKSNCTASVLFRPQTSRSAIAARIASDESSSASDFHEDFDSSCDDDAVLWRLTLNRSARLNDSAAPERRGWRDPRRVGASAPTKDDAPCSTEDLRDGGDAAMDPLDDVLRAIRDCSTISVRFFPSDIDATLLVHARAAVRDVFGTAERALVPWTYAQVVAGHAAAVGE
jgi:hypothetical protein